MSDVRTMTAGELAAKIPSVLYPHEREYLAELERRAAIFDRLEAMTADRWYFRLERTPDGAWTAQRGAAAEVECPTALAAVEKALQEPQP